MIRPLFAALLLSLAGAAAPNATAPCADGYRVVRGDTLYRLARRCHSSVAAIARASGIRNPDRIEVGQRLHFGMRLASRRVATAYAAMPAAMPGRARTASEPLVYRMARADTLFSLARWSRTSLPTLLAANPGIDPHKIEIGDPVRLPAGAVAPERARARERGPATAATPAPSASPRVRQRRSDPRTEEPAPQPERRREAPRNEDPVAM
jgi:LysM repeat protein